MIDRIDKKSTMAIFAMISLLAHLSVSYVMGLLRPFELGAPVSPLTVVTVILKEPDAAPPQRPENTDTGINGANSEPVRQMAAKEERGIDSVETATSRSNLTPPAIKNAVSQEPAGETSPATEDRQGTERSEDISSEGNKENPGAVPVSAVYELNHGPVRQAGEFLAARREKLTYRISLLKVPVGTAIVEAANTDGELRITARIASNAAISSFYPVDDFVETRMIKGNYLLTRVKQAEGSYRGDFGFTLMLREHKAFWVDRLTKRYDYQPLPVDDVMDVVSGFYFLRNQVLEVGKEVLLHLFDSNEYSPTTVEVLRREHISLPGSRGVDTLVLHPLFKTAGFFRRTGDITIWLTDDEFKVPVRLETTVPLGKVKAELISAETEKPAFPPNLR